MDIEEKNAGGKMKSQSGDLHDPEREGRELKAFDDLSADEMVILARRYYGAGFPNPQRRGCPPQSEILEMVSGGQAPGELIRAHLFECSECFGEYRQALAQYRDEIAVAPSAGWRRIFSILMSRRIWAAVILLSVFFVVGLVLRKLAPPPNIRFVEMERSTASDSRIGDVKDPRPNEVEVATSAGITPPPANRRTVIGTSRVRSLPEVHVDLDEYQVLREPQEGKTPGVDEKPSGKADEGPLGERDENPPEVNHITLPAARARLVLRLPETGAAGDYKVSLVGAFGQVLLSQHAVSRDGVKLRVTLDLRRIAPEKYRLRLSREGEAPAFYDVIIKKR